MSEPTSFRPFRWLAISAAVPLCTCLAAAGFMSIPPSRGNIDIVAGRDAFRARCGACHFAKAGFPAHHGPNLHDIGRTGALRKPEQTAAEYILESILDPAAFVAPKSRPGMPNNVAADLSPEETRNIVAFLASCGAFPDYEEIKGLEIPDLRVQQTTPLPVRLEDMELAEHVLQDKGRCLQCHRRHSHPEYKVFAPGLFGVGLTDTKMINESIVDPHKTVSPIYQSVNVVLTDGSVLSGKLLSRTDDELVLFTRDPQSRLVRQVIPLSDVEEEDGELLILESKVSAMPTGFDESLTKEEIEAVMTLIRQLN